MLVSVKVPILRNEKSLNDDESTATVAFYDEIARLAIVASAKPFIDGP
jgi:hypothetical protein